MKNAVKIFLFLMVVFTNSSFPQAITITIDKIIPDNWITGHVQGLSSKEVYDYKVIVYVHTDQWYIHPYAGQGEGKSWAVIKEDGTWQIPTVRREFPADYVAALLVRRSFTEPDRIEKLTYISYRAIAIKDVSVPAVPRQTPGRHLPGSF